MAKLSKEESRLFNVCKKELGAIIRENSSRIEEDPEIILDEHTRYRMKDRVMVEDAIQEMWVRLLNREDNPFEGVDSTLSVARKAYHHAVDTYFDVYHCAPPSNRVGRPLTELEELARILKLRASGKKITEICAELSIEATPQNYDLIRKRLKVAKSAAPENNIVSELTPYAPV